MRQKKAAKAKPFHLPIAAETIFRRPHKRKISKDVEQKGIFITRIFAKGGYVVTQYADYDKGTDGQVMMPPKEALRRAQALRAVPKEFLMEDMIPAIIQAAHAAMQQTIDGGNPLFNQNRDLLNIPKQLEEIKAEIDKERQEDPVLNEEMSKIEIDNKIRKG